uniref:Uncharacterized protein n=1 Tax=Physcomitrium patens TaxID=3218 RepID=A0A2K1IJB1_PHYPA|nr:hypothetical protein PHYPA_028056 [Physcomitrium patens]
MYVLKFFKSKRYKRIKRLVEEIGGIMWCMNQRKS